MAEEFQGGVCGGNLWNTSKNLFGLSSCSSDWGFPPLISDDNFRLINHDPIIDANTSSHESGTSEENYSHILPESNMNFSENSFPMNSDSYSLFQTLFDTDNFQTTNCSPLPLTYQMNSAEFSDGLTMVKPTFTKHQGNNNVVPFWNGNIPTSFVPSSLHSAKPNFQNFSVKRRKDEERELDSSKVNSKLPELKRARIETPSPLPTFKVRKEKMGDRVTALQQLVSPFGKTDTASVLHEAIEYIKFLHDQVNALSTPYLKNTSSPLQIGERIIKDQEGNIGELRSRGLCLVPVSSTYPVAAETTSDFWTPSFGGTLR